MPSERDVMEQIAEKLARDYGRECDDNAALRAELRDTEARLQRREEDVNALNAACLEGQAREDALAAALRDCVEALEAHQRYWMQTVPRRGVAIEEARAYRAEMAAALIKARALLGER